MAQRAAVFSSYRRLYRARIALFRSDVEAMTKSRDAVRVEYLRHGTTDIADETHFQSLLGMADEAADMLRHSIIQGRLNEKSGNYGKFEPLLWCTTNTVPVVKPKCASQIIPSQSKNTGNDILISILFAEIKVNENHIAKHTGILGQQPPLIQPITKEVVQQMEEKARNPTTTVKVETTKAASD